MKNKLYILTETGLRIKINPPEWERIVESDTQLKNPVINDELKNIPLHQLTIEKRKIVKAVSSEIKEREKRAFTGSIHLVPSIKKSHLSREVKLALAIVSAILLILGSFLYKDIKISVSYKNQTLTQDNRGE